MSRLERGLRPDTTSEEIAAILAIVGVTGAERERLLRMAKSNNGEGWWEHNPAMLTDQASTYLRFEHKATKIIDVEPLLVPGLLQTPDYCRTVMVTGGVDDEHVEGRIARRLGRQVLLTRPVGPELVFIVSELMLRQPFGGARIMARQVRHMIEIADHPRVSIRVIPASLAEHPGVFGAFMVLEFEEEPPVVHIEGRMSGMFPENPNEIDGYRLIAERLTDLTLDPQRALDALGAIAEDLERAR